LETVREFKKARKVEKFYLSIEHIPPIEENEDDTKTILLLCIMNIMLTKERNRLLMLLGMRHLENICGMTFCTVPKKLYRTKYGDFIRVLLKLENKTTVKRF
jgi:hypothetical protein